MKNSSNLATLVAFIIALVILVCAYSLSPKSSSDVTVVERTASVPEGSTLVLYYSSRLYFISSVEDHVTVSIKTSFKTYQLAEVGENTKVPLVGINTVDVKKPKPASMSPGHGT